MMPAALAILFLFSLVLAAVVGLALLLYPEALYNLEGIANQWTSTNNLLEWFENEKPPIDQHILRHRLSAGLLITAGSLYVLIAVGYFLATGSLL
jgi:predicted PurR-regulated permease PerM